MCQRVSRVKHQSTCHQGRYHLQQPCFRGILSREVTTQWRHERWMLEARLYTCESNEAGARVVISLYPMVIVAVFYALAFHLSSEYDHAMHLPPVVMKNKKRIVKHSLSAASSDSSLISQNAIREIISESLSCVSRSLKDMGSQGKWGGWSKETVVNLFLLEA